MIKTSVYIATSVDGFIAREDGGLDWLPTGEDGSGEDYGYHAFMDSVDVLVMGRSTFDLVITFGAWPYGEKPVVVLTTRPLTLPDNFPDTISTMSGSPQEVLQRLESRGYAHGYIDGGVTIQNFLREGLINALIITRIPVLLGSGIPLFGALPHDVNLHHIETTQYPNGFVQSKYEIA